MNSLDYYVTIADEEIAKDKDRDDLFKKIDNVVACRWDLPEAIARLPGVRKATITRPSDAVSAATRTFSTLDPHFEVSPLAPNKDEVNRMEMLETWMEWQFYMLNRRAPVLREIVRSAIKYMAIALQVEYLPFSMKGRKGPRFKKALKIGDFVWRVHNPANVHVREDAYGTQSVVLFVQKTVKTLIDEFGEDNSGIKKLVKNLESDTENKGKDILSTLVGFYDYTDWTDRVQWVKYGDNIEIGRKEHGLGFLPWVVVDDKEPILEKIISAKLWEDACLIATIKRWGVVVAASHPAYFSRTPSGKGLNISYNNPAGELRGRPGDEIVSLTPRYMDPHISEVEREILSEMDTSTVARALQTLDFSANMPYSSVNAILTAAVASLSPQRKLAERAITEGLYQMLCWVKYSNIDSQGQRRYTKDEENPLLSAGSPVTVMAQYPANPMPANFIYIDNPDDIMIQVELQADTTTDEQQRVNMAMNLAQLGLPKSWIADELHIPNFDIQRQRWMQEQMEEAELRAEQAITEGQAQIRLQQMVQEQQQQTAQAQQQQMAQDQSMQQQTMAQEQGMIEPNPAAQGMGYATGAGGLPPQGVNPGGMGRVQVQGQDVTGAGIAPV